MITASVGDSGHDPERTAAAKRAGGHIQSKHTPQQPRPVPARCSSVGLIPTYTLLARRWNDCPRAAGCAAPDSPRSARDELAAGVRSLPAKLRIDAL